MRNVWLSMVTAVVFCAAAAVAQSTQSTSQSPGTSGTTNTTTSPSGTQARSPEGVNAPSDMNSQAGIGQGYGHSPSSPGQGVNTAQAGENDNAGQAGNANANHAAGEKRLKGCIESQNGQYVLKTKKGKDIALTGNDVSSQVGHEVVVHGMWSGSAAAAGAPDSNVSNAPHEFDVTAYDLISNTCGGKTNNGGAMGTQPQ
jgi:hypothetical protein